MKWAEPKECEGPYCDRKFYPTRSDARFCSDTCRQQAHRQRKAGVTAVTANPTVAQGIPAVTAVTANSAVAERVTAVTDSDLDAEIAELSEQIRRALWWNAATRWRSHYEEPWTPPFEDEERPIPALVYVWQQRIDTGRVQPVTEYIPFAEFDAPDLPWPGLGLDNRYAEPGYEDWWDVWDYVDDAIPGVLDQARRLQRRWIERQVWTQISGQVDGLFDEDGDWKPDRDTESLRFSEYGHNTIEVPKPTFFTDDLVQEGRELAR